MNFSVVKHRFKPVSSSAVDELVRKHAGTGRVEQAVYLDEVGIDSVARQVVREASPKRMPAAAKAYSF